MDPYPPIWIHIGNINLYEFNMFYINSITTASLENLNMFYLFETFKCPYKHIPCVKSTMLPYDAADSYIPILPHIFLYSHTAHDYLFLNGANIFLEREQCLGLEQEQVRVVSYSI